MKYKKFGYKSDHHYILKNCYVFRRPKTLQEMKWADEYTRPRRKKLPTFWDDLTISRAIVTSWKDRSKKKHQYLPG